MADACMKPYLMPSRRAAPISSHRGDHGAAPATAGTAEEKARIVAESFEEGANISEVAWRYGVVRGCSRYSGASSRRQRAFRRQASCRSGLLPTAVRRRQTSHLRIRCCRRWHRPKQAWRVDRDERARIRVEPGVNLVTLSMVCRREVPSFVPRRAISAVEPG